MGDAARYRRVYSNDWVEAAFRSLDDGQRVVALYCRTGPQSTSVGAYRLSTAVAVEDLQNVTTEQFTERFDVVRAALGWWWDGEVRVLWMPEWLDRNPPQSANVASSWRKLLNNLPECSLKYQVFEHVHRYLKALQVPKREAYLQAFGSLPKDFNKVQPQPKAQTGSDQGVRDLSGIFQGKQGNQENRQRKAVENANLRLVDIARNGLTVMQGHGDEDIVHYIAKRALDERIQFSSEKELTTALSVARGGRS